MNHPSHRRRRREKSSGLAAQATAELQLSDAAGKLNNPTPAGITSHSKSRRAPGEQAQCKRVLLLFDSPHAQSLETASHICQRTGAN